MGLDIRFDCSRVEWRDVMDILKDVGMAYDIPEVLKRAFEASFVTVFVYSDARLVGFGRAISDGVYQAAVYDVAVVREWQAQGLGLRIMQEIMRRLPGCNVILYASPGKEGFYGKLGLRKMKTGMALFQKPDQMRDRGFTE